MEIVIACIGILTGACSLALVIKTRREILKEQTEETEALEENTLDEAVDVIKEYCKGQTEEGRCCFNLHKDNSECECILLKMVPEEWHDNKEQTDKNILPEQRA